MIVVGVVGDLLDGLLVDFISIDVRLTATDGTKDERVVVQHVFHVRDLIKFFNHLLVDLDSAHNIVYKKVDLTLIIIEYSQTSALSIPGNQGVVRVLIFFSG